MITEDQLGDMQQRLHAIRDHIETKDESELQDVFGGCKNLLIMLAVSMESEIVALRSAKENRNAYTELYVQTHQYQMEVEQYGKDWEEYTEAWKQYAEELEGHFYGPNPPTKRPTLTLIKPNKDKGDESQD